MNTMFDSSSPIEALVLNYTSFGVFNVVNNLWTWVAVLTAAISYWRIRTVSVSDKPNHHHHHQQQQQQQPRIDPKISIGSRSHPSANTCVVEPHQAPSPSPSPAHISALTSSVSNNTKEADGGIIEGSKYTAYYYYEEEEDDDEEERESDGDGEVTVVKEWRDYNGVSSGEGRWERVKIRGDLGWYGYQDLTVINGNVVRLWEECRRRSGKRCSSDRSCGGAVWYLDN